MWNPRHHGDGVVGRDVRRRQPAAGDRSRKALAIGEIELRWPTTGRVLVFRDVPMDRLYRIVEGDAAITPLLLNRIPL